MAEKVVAVKMLGKLVIVLEELVGAALSLTDMALVVILIEVLMKLAEIIEPPRPAKVTERVALEAAPFSVPLGQVELQSRRCKPRQFAYEVPFLFHTQVAKRTTVFRSKVLVQSLHSPQSLNPSFLLRVGLVFTVH